MNNINVVEQSPLFSSIARGKFTPSVPFTPNGEARDISHYLIDGVYPPCAVFVNTVRDPETEKEKLFARMQEAVRKDAKRAFGVLKSAWKILDRPCNYWRPETLANITKTVCILHNMAVEGRRKKDL